MFPTFQKPEPEPQPEYQPPTSDLKIENWRLQQLLDAGYDLNDAQDLARRRDVDLHRAVDLAKQVIDVGLATSVAADILR